MRSDFGFSNFDERGFEFEILGFSTSNSTVPSSPAPIFARAASSTTTDDTNFDIFRRTNVKDDSVDFDQFRATTGVIISYEEELFAALSGRESPYIDQLIDLESFNSVNELISSELFG